MLAPEVTLHTSTGELLQCGPAPTNERFRDRDAGVAVRYEVPNFALVRNVGAPVVIEDASCSSNVRSHSLCDAVPTNNVARATNRQAEEALETRCTRAQHARRR